MKRLFLISLILLSSGFVNGMVPRVVRPAGKVGKNTWDALKHKVLTEMVPKAASPGIQSGGRVRVGQRFASSSAPVASTNLVPNLRKAADYFGKIRPSGPASRNAASRFGQHRGMATESLKSAYENSNIEEPCGSSLGPCRGFSEEDPELAGEEITEDDVKLKMTDYLKNKKFDGVKDLVIENTMDMSNEVFDSLLEMDEGEVSEILLLMIENTSDEIKKDYKEKLDVLISGSNSKYGGETSRLGYAAYNNLNYVVKKFIEMGADPTVSLGHYSSLIDFAFLNQNNDLLRFIINNDNKYGYSLNYSVHDYDLNQKVSLVYFMRKLLVKAIQQGNTDLAQFIINKANSDDLDIFSIGDYKKDMFMLTSNPIGQIVDFVMKQSDEYTLEKLLEKNEDVDIQNLLLKAIKTNKKDIFLFLISKLLNNIKVNFKFKSSSGFTRSSEVLGEEFMNWYNKSGENKYKFKQGTTAAGVGLVVLVVANIALNNNEKKELAQELAQHVEPKEPSEDAANDTPINSEKLLDDFYKDVSKFTEEKPKVMEEAVERYAEVEKTLDEKVTEDSLVSDIAGAQGIISEILDEETPRYEAALAGSEVELNPVALAVEQGINPVHLLAEKDEPGYLSEVLEKGYDINALNTEGKTALDVAKSLRTENYEPVIIQLLKDSGAKTAHELGYLGQAKQLAKDAKSAAGRQAKSWASWAGEKGRAAAGYIPGWNQSEEVAEVLTDEEALAAAQETAVMEAEIEGY